MRSTTTSKLTLWMSQQKAIKYIKWSMTLKIHSLSVRERIRKSNKNSIWKSIQWNCSLIKWQRRFTKRSVKNNSSLTVFSCYSSNKTHKYNRLNHQHIHFPHPPAMLHSFCPSHNKMQNKKFTNVIISSSKLSTLTN